ncbi:MAG: hypothetical protein J1F38_03335 [Muribaculaceae bacterium]|nr:hypothetical protein [Muribaculaceae bacterium]
MRSLLYIIILCFITGCSYSASQSHTLDEAQRLMDSDPSAAWTKLNSLDISELKDSSTMARWALLYSEAMVANHITAPTDTIVNIAINYYGNHHLTDEYQQALRLKALNQQSTNTDALATALYLQKEKEFFLYKERVKQEQMLFIGIIILLSAVGIIVWLQQRLKMQTLRNDSLMAEASSFRSEIEASKGNVNRLESKLHGLLENRFTLIDSLCQTYYETQGTKTERKAIIDKVKSEIESVRTDSFPKMEQAVNDCKDNLLVLVKEKYPDIKPEVYQLLVYLASGLSTRTISLLMGETVDVIYKRKSRLKTRLKETMASEYPDILSIF